MKIIYKYEAKPGRFTLTLPIIYKFLDVKFLSENEMVFWILTDTDSIHFDVNFLTIPTGVGFDNFPGDWDYIGTGINPIGYVMHLFREFA